MNARRAFGYVLSIIACLWTTGGVVALIFVISDEVESQRQGTSWDGLDASGFYILPVLLLLFTATGVGMLAVGEYLVRTSRAHEKGSATAETEETKTAPKA